jgi:membrane-associated phospholipid phosphatase
VPLLEIGTMSAPMRHNLPDNVASGGLPAPLGARGHASREAGEGFAWPLALLGLGSGALFAALAILYDRGFVVSRDRELERWRAQLPGWVPDVGHAFDWLGGHWWLPPVVLVAFALLVRTRRYAGAVFLVAAAGGSDAFLHAVKVFSDRDRPGEGVALPATAAFPSGHATTALAIYVGLVLAASPRRGRVQVGLVAAAAVLAVAIGAGRFFYGVKTASDVAGGALLGVFWLTFIVLVRRRLANRRTAA